MPSQSVMQGVSAPTKSYSSRHTTQVFMIVGTLGTRLIPGPTQCSMLVSCPTRAHLPARNGLVNEVEFLGLLPKTGDDQ